MTARTQRPAFTLFEILLVLCVLVMLAGLLYPSIKSMFGYYKLHGGVDSVRAAWAHARSRAIDEGRPYRFSVEPNGSHYRVAPDDDSQEGGLVLEQALPAGVHFSIGEAPSGPPGEVSTRVEENSPPSGEWVPAAVFLPDGTARQDACMTFQVNGVAPLALRLRGLTGMSSVQPVKP